MSSFVQYIRLNLCEFVLMALYCYAGSGLVASGFWAGDALFNASAVVAATVFATLAVLYACAYSKRGVVLGVVVVPVLTVVALLAVDALDGGVAVFSDEMGNLCIPLLLAVVVTVCSFLLSRRMPGVVVLAVASVLVVGYLQFIYKENHVLLAVLLFAALLALFGYRSFATSRSTSGQMPGHTLVACAVCALNAVLVVVLACSVYFVAVAPNNPPTMEIKLIKEYLALPQLDLRGVADSTRIEDEDNQTNRSDDGEQQASGEGGQTPEEGGGGQSDTPMDGASNEAYDADADEAGYNPVWHTLVAEGLVWPLLPVLVVAGAVAAKLAARRYVRARMYALDRAAFITALYARTLKLFRRMRLPRNVALTPLEYAHASRNALSDFNGGEGADFMSVSKTFSKVAYGNGDVSDAEYERARAFEAALYANCKKHLGPVRYALLFFVL